MPLDTVQKWVMSVLAVSTVSHLGSFAAWTAVTADPGRLDARIGLNVLAGCIGMVALASGFLIHQRSPLTPWLLVGLLPGVVGALLTFR